MSMIDTMMRKKSSGNVARDRLKLVLVSDRATCSPKIMEMIKNDIIEVISKYIDIDSDGLEIQMTQTENENRDGSSPAIYANIPIKGMKKR